MALSTVCLHVWPNERAAGFGVIKGVLATLAPPDEFEVPAVVIDVATLTVFEATSCVQAQPRRDSPSQSVVAGEAQSRVSAVASVVTLQTPVGAFQVLVGRAQVAGRELAVRCRDSEPEEKVNKSAGDDDPETSHPARISP